MAQQSLEAERVDASFQQMRGKTVTQMPSSAFCLAVYPQWFGQWRG
jgi:hypothetical protein